MCIITNSNKSVSFVVRLLPLSPASRVLSSPLLPPSSLLTSCFTFFPCVIYFATDLRLPAPALPVPYLTPSPRFHLSCSHFHLRTAVRFYGRKFFNL